MLRRFTSADWAGALGVAFGLAAAYLPWYSYTSGAARITVTGFRASVLGDVFFLTVAAAVALLLSRHGYIDERLAARVRPRAASAALAATAAATVVLQFILVAGGGRSAGGGLLLALVATIALGGSAWLLPPDTHSRQSGNGTTGRELLSG